MLLHVVARGRIGRSAEADLYARYMKRIVWPTKLTELPETGAKMPPVEPGTKLVAMDETGAQLRSQDFAGLLGRWRDDGVREARFLIGAADGLEPELLTAADQRVAFGSATWPHLLARAMLAEQLYRATSILAGHPYHREG